MTSSESTSDLLAGVREPFGGASQSGARGVLTRSPPALARRGSCQNEEVRTVIALPGAERRQGLAGLLYSRRSTKRFDTTQALDVEDVSAMLWAAAGSTTPPRRVCPSARASNPIVVTLVAGEVSGLGSGCYRYDPLDHALAPGSTGDHRVAVATGTLDASGWLTNCPALLLLTADLGAACRRFPDQPPEHGERFVWMEAGHSVQNVYLLAAELDFGACLVAGLDDEAITTACRPLVPFQHQVLGILGLGRAAI